MQSIEITCKNTGLKKEYPLGITLEEIAKDQNIQLEDKILAAIVNNKIRELNYAVFKPKTVEFFDKNDSSNGYRIYMRASLFILYKAVKNLYPHLSLRVAHSLPYGYFCAIEDGQKKDLTPDQEMIDKISVEMQHIIAADYPFERKLLPTEDAIQIYKENGLNEKVELFSTRNNIYTSVYFLDHTPNYFYGYLPPSTSYIDHFKILPYFDGLILLWQIYADPTPENQRIWDKIRHTKRESALFRIFKEHQDWLELLEIPFVGNLNRCIDEGKGGDIIKISEALHEKRIARIADEIQRRQQVKLVLVSGPSSSGKTTFSKRLSIHLKVLGYKTAELSLDDYFVNREFTPKDENGDFDFESIDAIDLKFFNEQLQLLLSSNNQEIEIPTFDFLEGKRKFLGKKIKMTPETILIVEGIHGLNPRLTESIPDQQKFKIFVSALTHIGIDTQNPISSSDNRLIRRIVRDYKYRGYSGSQTIARWPSVKRGEYRNIFPFQENADMMFNSALIFELGVLKKHAEPILHSVRENEKEYTEARRLLKFFSYFHCIDEKEIPPTSILREFLGESSFTY